MGKKRKKRKPEAPIGLDKILVPTEEKRFMDYLVSVSGDEGGVRNCLIFDLLLQTGMRVSELCNLRVKDTPKYLGGNVIRVHLGKGKRSRDIPISQRMRTNISAYLRDYRPATLPDAVRVSDRRKPVFYSPQKRPYRRDQIAYQIRKFILWAGIDKHVTPHMCRHTFATISLFQDRISLARLQIIMGHAKVSTTERYLHVVELLDPKLGNAIDRGVWVLSREKPEYRLHFKK